MSNIKYTEDYHIIDENKIYYKYYRNGLPTVLFEAGLGDDSVIWEEIQDKVSQYTTTFSYDRVGVRKSESAEGALITRTGLNIVQDLSILVSKIPLNPPFLLVGHSFGGLISRLFASINPDNVAGIILIDSAPENKEIYFQKALKDKEKVKIKKYLENPDLNTENIDKIKTYNEIVKYKSKFNFPLTIIIRGLAKCYGSSWPEDSLLEIEHKLQLDLKKLSEMSKTIIAKNSGHYIHKDEPNLVIKEIRQMIDKINS